MYLVDPSTIAQKYLAQSKISLSEVDQNLHIVGLIASDDSPSIAYARATKQVFQDAGFDYELRQVKRLDLEKEILAANDDNTVHGIFIYFPVFKNQQDEYLRNLVHYTKDIEAGSSYWTHKLYSNDRLAISGDSDKKALLPCTPLAIVKILEDLSEYGEGGEPLANKRVTIFNRSEVIGRPLAIMMSNDGAIVYSFDENGPMQYEQAKAQECEITRTQALAESDIIVTGVPNEQFQKIQTSELKATAVCLNFSSVKNFSADVPEYVKTFVPRVGPMTVAMCMRNTIRLYKNFRR